MQNNETYICSFRENFREFFQINLLTKVLVALGMFNHFKLYTIFKLPWYMKEKEKSEEINTRTEPTNECSHTLVPNAFASQTYIVSLFLAALPQTLSVFS